ncbi:MAG: hypothetical protein HY521_08500, partial [Proteobacteria bacterium]|nr:hypothetical protein [Pseudomonadota bacterium]
MARDPDPDSVADGEGRVGTGEAGFQRQRDTRGANAHLGAPRPGVDALQADDRGRRGRPGRSPLVGRPRRRASLRGEGADTRAGHAIEDHRGRDVSKPAASQQPPETTAEAGDGPLLDTLGAALKKMIARGKERGYVTYDEINAALPTEQVSSEQIEDTLSMLNEIGINVVDGEETEEAHEPADLIEAETTAGGNIDEEDLGRTDDPVRMYLREMGSVELLSREGEIAIAKRIEAGRDMMIGGLCENPLTIRAILEWRNSLKDGEMLLRDVIDLDVTYGRGPGAEGAAAAPADDRAVPAPAQGPIPAPTPTPTPTP